MDEDFVLLIASIIILLISLIGMIFIRGWFLIIPMVISILYMEVYMDKYIRR